MVWWFTSIRHELALGWARTWIRAGLADRFLQTFAIGLPWWFFWGVISAVSRSVEPLLLLGWLPWLFWLVDAIIDRLYTSSQISHFMGRDDVVLATRAEYVGGHPQLPHGRFGYLTINGERENPMLTFTFPSLEGEGDRFDMPLLDLDRTKPESQWEQSDADKLLASLNVDSGGLFSGERVTLAVDYQGPGGRKHEVELTSFFHGNDEIRNWRNYLVCAQAEADTGVTPFGPWKSLRPAPVQEEVTSDDGSGDGSKMQPARRAFDRR